MQAGKGFNEALLTPVLEYGMGLDATQRKLLFKTVKYINPSSNALETLGETGREIVKIADERAETARVNRDYNGSAWAALKKGEVGKAANYGFKDFAMSFPSSALYMTGWGAALMSGGMVSNEIRELEEQGKEVNSKEILGATIKSALEVATERMFGAGKAGKELIQNLGRPAAERAVREAIEALVKKALGWKFAKLYSEEVFGEEVNTIGANAVDIYLYGNKNKGLFDGIGDTFIQALIGSTVQGGPATVINHRIDTKRIAEANAMKEQAVKLTEQAMEQPTEAAAQALEEKALELNKQAEDILTEERDMALNLSQETLDN